MTWARQHLKWLPNAVTASRGFAGPLVAWLLVAHQAHVAAFFVFVGAMLTDLIDGWLAKKLDAVTTAGFLLDPISDKFLVNSTWLALWWIGWAPTWLALPVMLRDLIVVCGFSVAWATGYRWRASVLARTMVAFEGTTLPMLLVHVVWWDVHWYSVGVVLGIMTLGLSLASALEYVWRGPESVG